MTIKSKFRIKILFVVGNNVLNGTERYVVDIASRLPEDSFEVWVATPESGELSNTLKENLINEFIYGNKKLDKFTFHGARNLYNFIKKNQFDVIHANTGIIPCIIGKLLRVKLCVETKHGLFFTQQELESLSFKQRFIEKSKENFVDVFITLSENDKDRLIKFFKIKEAKIKIIYNGIDFKLFEKLLSAGEKLKKRKIVIGNIGRLTYQKGQDILLKSFLKLLTFEENIELIIIGNGENKPMLDKIIFENNLSDKVKIINYKKNIFDYFSQFDIFVLTSRFEGVPYVLLEAMKLGIPIISTDVGGINEVIQNDMTGILVQVDNEDEVTNAIRRLINEDELYMKLRSNALNIIEKFNIKKMVSEYEEFYVSMINFDLRN